MGDACDPSEEKDLVIPADLTWKAAA